MKHLKDLKIQVNHFNKQQGSLGLPFRLSAITRGDEGQYKSEWFYIFKYDDGKLFALNIGVNGEFIKKLDDTEVRDMH